MLHVIVPLRDIRINVFYNIHSSVMSCDLNRAARSLTFYCFHRESEREWKRFMRYINLMREWHLREIDAIQIQLGVKFGRSWHNESTIRKNNGTYTRHFINFVYYFNHQDIKRYKNAIKIFCTWEHVCIKKIFQEYTSHLNHVRLINCCNDKDV